MGHSRLSTTETYLHPAERISTVGQVVDKYLSGTDEEKETG